MKNLKVIYWCWWHLYSSTKLFAETEKKFCGLMEDYLSSKYFKELFKMEIDNLKLYGYGIKAISFPWLKQQCAFQITLSHWNNRKILMVKKNYLKTDCFIRWCWRNTEAFAWEIQTSSCHQRRFIRSAENFIIRLGHYFHHIEVMSDKQEVDYTDLIRRLKLNHPNFWLEIH
jgi:putative hydrolase of the HAD superfamily